MRYLTCSAGLLLLATNAMASETETYTYDAQGRLIKVEHSGDVNDDVNTEYEHDDADNRTRKKTTGA